LDGVLGKGLRQQALVVADTALENVRTILENERVEWGSNDRL
jgi:hypothetical protein